MMRLVLLMLMIALAMLNIAMLEAKPANNGLPMVHASFPSCLQLHPCAKLNCQRRIA